MYRGGGGEVIGFAALRPGFTGPRRCGTKNRLKIKSTVMQTTINLFRKVHNYTHFKGLFTQFERKRNEKMANFKAPNRRLVPRFQ